MKSRSHPPKTVKKAKAADKTFMVDKWNSGHVFITPGLNRKPKANKNLFPTTSDSYACQ